MDRETAKQIAMQIAIAMHEDAIRVHGRDAIVIMAPCYGKCTWTYGELYDVAVADVVPENQNKTAGDNILSLNKYWLERYGRELVIEDVKIKN